MIYTVNEEMCYLEKDSEEIWFSKKMEEQVLIGKTILKPVTEDSAAFYYSDWSWKVTPPQGNTKMAKINWCRGHDSKVWYQDEVNADKSYPLQMQSTLAYALVQETQERTAVT